MTTSKPPLPLPSQPKPLLLPTFPEGFLALRVLLYLVPHRTTFQPTSVSEGPIADICSLDSRTISRRAPCPFLQILRLSLPQPRHVRGNNQHLPQPRRTRPLLLGQTHRLRQFAASLRGLKFIALTTHFLSSPTLTNLLQTATRTHRSYLTHNLKTQHTHFRPIKPSPSLSTLRHPKQPLTQHTHLRPTNLSPPLSTLRHPKQPPTSAHRHLDPRDLARWQSLDQPPCLRLGPATHPPSPAKGETPWTTSYASTRR